MKDYSNFHNINTKAKIEHDALLMLESSLNGYAGKDVLINGTLKTKLILSQRYDSDGESYKIIGLIDDIERGNLIKFNNEYWLVTSKPEDNGIYRKAIMTICSATFPVKEDDKKIFIGTDVLQRPVYDIVPGKTVDIPCVVSMNEATVAIADTNKPINLLNNVVYITIPYTESKSIGYDEEFEMYGSIYRIIRIDVSKSSNKVGLTKITAEVKGFKKGDNNE